MYVSYIQESTRVYLMYTIKYTYTPDTCLQKNGVPEMKILEEEFLVDFVL